MLGAFITMKIKSFIQTGIFFLIVATGNASAMLINPSFEDEPDLIGWTFLGDVTQSNEFATDGIFSARIFPSIAIGDIETALSLNPGTIDDLTVDGTGGSGKPTNGAAIYQEFSVNIGDTISFDFMFNDNDTADFRDTAIALLQIGSDLASIVLGFTTGTANEGDGDITGSEMFTAAATGAAKLSFIVFNQGDKKYDSKLFIDSVEKTVIPLPATVWMLAAALVALLGFSRRHNLAQNLES